MFKFSCVIVTSSSTICSFSLKGVYPLYDCTASLFRRSSVDLTLFLIFLGCVLRVLWVFSKSHPPFRRRWSYYRWIWLEVTEFCKVVSLLSYQGLRSLCQSIRLFQTNKLVQKLPTYWVLWSGFLVFKLLWLFLYFAVKIFLRLLWSTCWLCGIPRYLCLFWLHFPVVLIFPLLFFDLASSNIYNGAFVITKSHLSVVMKNFTVSIKGWNFS